MTRTWSPRMLSVIGMICSYSSMLTSSLDSDTLVMRAFSPLKAPVTISTMQPTSMPLVTALGSR